jgi:hypothetical protein
MKDRLPMLLAMRKEHLCSLRANASDPAKDRSGTATSSLQGTLRFIGVAEFAVAGDVGSFRSYLTEVAELGLRLLERHDRGEGIDPSYVAMVRYKDIFSALAAGKVAVAAQLGERLGGRPHIEEEQDHSFDRSLGHVLKSLVSGPPDQVESRFADFAAVCREPENTDFTGYAVAFRGILDHDVGRVQEGLMAVVKGHKNLVKRGGVFHDLEDEVLCVWGVGVANLARSRGMSITGLPPFIPNELLCGG